jgi:hypothetical protein
MDASGLDAKALEDSAEVSSSLAGMGLLVAFMGYSPLRLLKLR